VAFLLFDGFGREAEYIWEKGKERRKKKMYI
jgi:hypothetical protein